MQTRKNASEKAYRLEIYLPRDLSAKLEELKKRANEQSGKKVSKSSLVVEIMREFFER